jgi:PAS domain S-box-containing protein
VQAAAAAGVPEGVILLAPRRARQPDDPRISPGRAARTERRRAARQRDDSVPAGITPAMLWALVNALADGVLVADDEGVLMLANRRAEELFGYARGELTGQRVESLVPASLRGPHVSQRAGYAREPVARPMGARARLAGLRKDGTTFPVRISLRPVPTATGRLTMAVIRDISADEPPADLAELARAAAAAQDAHRGREILNRMVNGLFRVGLSMQSTADLPDEMAVQQLADALQCMDDIIHEARGYIFADPGHDHTPPDGSR